MNNNTLNDEAVYDATRLGYPKMLVLGLQHTFAMFGATVLVPLLTGLDVSTTLLFAGLGTLLSARFIFHSFVTAPMRGLNTPSVTSYSLRESFTASAANSETFTLSSPAEELIRDMSEEGLYIESAPSISARRL